jgi:putative membrane protein insertion efficiency factor
MIARLLALPLHAYRRFISPLKPRCCRFWPSCSQYAIEALRRRSLPVAGALIAWRLLRCQPFAAPGYDPVPPPRGRAQRRVDSSLGGGDST